MADSELAALLRQSGYSGHDAHIIADLSEHASMEAVQALTRVVDSAPEALRLVVIMTATKLLKTSLDKFLPSAEHLIALKAASDIAGKL